MTRLPYDPDLAGPLAGILQFAAAPLLLETIAEARAHSSTFAPPLETLVAGTELEVTEVEAPGDERSPAVVMTVIAKRGLDADAPAIVVIHGGGMVMGTRYSGAEHLVLLAQQLPARVISVEYRLAPEHPFPAAADDVLTAWRWIVSNAAQLGVDPDRLILLGESAGGGIAAGLSLRLRDEGERMPQAQALLAPMLDDRNDSGSSRAYDGVGLWDRRSNETGWTALLGAGPRADVSPYASPARASDLSGLPPTYLEVGSAEVFRDEVVAFASALWDGGVQAELHVWAGGFHAFEFIVPDAPVSKLAREARLTWLRRILDAHEVPSP